MSVIASQDDTERLVAHLFRHQAGKIIATLTRVFGARHLELAEDVVQDALIKALQQWPFKGIPPNPAAWLTLVARNRALDLLRRDSSWADKISELERMEPRSSPQVADPDTLDDQLALILLCSHPELSVEGQVALTLKTACGFSTSEIARAFLTPEATIAQRLVRAKRQIRDFGIAIEPPSSEDLGYRLDSVLRVIYLLFNEGYRATSGTELVRADLCEEAIRLAQLVVDQCEAERRRTCKKEFNAMRAKLPAVHALLALMLMQAARLPARVQDNGSLAILSLQDRSLWDQQLISLGLRHLGWSAEGETITSYHLQAEIAAKHVTAPSEAETDWPGIVNLYDELNRVEQTPIVALNAAIACSRAEGPQAGLRALDQIASDPALKDYHLLPAVRAQLWRLLGQLDEARTAYLQALECTCTEPERRFLLLQLDELSLSGASTGQR